MLKIHTNIVLLATVAIATSLIVIVAFAVSGWASAQDGDLLAPAGVEDGGGLLAPPATLSATTSTIVPDSTLLTEPDATLHTPATETTTVVTQLPDDTTAPSDPPPDPEAATSTPENGYGGLGLISGEHYPPDRLIIAYKNPVGPVGVVDEANTFRIDLSETLEASHPITVGVSESLSDAVLTSAGWCVL